MEAMGSQEIVCGQCGGRDFRLEAGYMYCTECQLQTQEYQERVMDDFYGGVELKTKKVQDKKTVSEKAQSQDDAGSTTGSPQVSSWEVLNYVLKGLVDELILLGAPKSLKSITLQLWASYLGACGIAFTSTSFQGKPKFGIYHRECDAKLFYKAKTSAVKRIPKILGKKRKKDRRTGQSERAQKIKLLKEKRDLARDVYNESVASSSFADSPQTSFNLSSLSTSLASLSSRSSISKSENLRYSKKGKADVIGFLEEIAGKEDIIGFHQKYMKRARESVHHVTLTRVVAILRIALLISSSNIHVGDMRRWMEEGYLSMDCLHKFIPSAVRLTSYQVQMISQLPRYKYVSKITAEIVKLLSISDDPLPPNSLLSALVKRYCIMLNLPDVIWTGVERLLELRPLKASLSSPVTSNFEAKAMAFILFSLKILIGLDDATEYFYVPRRGVEGVKWEEWCRQYNARMAEKAVTHHPTLCRLYPNSYLGRDQALLSNWDPSIGKSSETKTFPKTMDPMTVESIQSTLTPLLCRLPEPSWKPGLEAETVRTGPPLIVLSESPNPSNLDPATRKLLRRRKKTFKLVHPSRENELNLSSSENVRVKLLSDEAPENDPVGEEPLSLYPSDRLQPCDKKREWMSTLNEFPDFNIWMYHDRRIVKMSNGKFDQFIREKLPFSFVWLLGEMSHLIFQSKKEIYLNLTSVEKYYSFKTLRIRRRRKKPETEDPRSSDGSE